MNACVLRMLKWDQAKALETITTELLKLPDADRPRATRYLDSRLAGEDQAKMPGVIKNWTSQLVLGDTRTAVERKLNNKLAAAKRNPEFSQRFDATVALFPNHYRKFIITTGTTPGGTYTSPLLLRVMGDPRGSLASMRDIQSILELRTEWRPKRRALHDWNPRNAQGRLQGAQRIPEFTKTEGEILGLFDPTTRAELKNPGVTSAGRYNSPLYERVLNDARGSVAAITDLHTVLQNAADRKQALEDWTPQTNPRPHDIADS